MEFAKYYQNHFADRKCMWFHFSWVCSFSSVFSTNLQVAEYGQLMLILNHAAGFKIVFTFEGYWFYFTLQEGLITFFPHSIHYIELKKLPLTIISQPVILCKYSQKAELPKKEQKYENIA